jgi:hypothetical protein
MSDLAPPPAGRKRRRYAVIAAVLAVVLIAGGLFAYDRWRRTQADMSELADALGKGMDQVLGQLGDEMKTASAFADRYVADLREGRLDEAYRATTADFQQKVDRERFAKVVQGNAALKDRASTVHTNFTKGTGGVKMTSSIRVQPNAEEGGSEIRLAVIDDGGGYKVQQLVLGGDTLP